MKRLKAAANSYVDFVMVKITLLLTETHTRADGVQNH